MRVVSVNVGLPRVHTWQGRFVRTAIFKDPIKGPVALRGDNFEGDAQADLSVHGGKDKAVYAYPADHYADWQALLGRDLSPGAFGENLTTEGLIEEHTHIGDEFRVGTARLVVTQPRMPCHKLGLRFGDVGMIRTFLKVGRPGIYFAVVEEGVVAPGDPGLGDRDARLDAGQGPRPGRPPSAARGPGAGRRLAAGVPGQARRLTLRGSRLVWESG
jgi:MOSC domain-containing protein YiiM